MSLVTQLRQQATELAQRMRVNRKRSAFRTVFGLDSHSPAADIVLADLAKFCHANTTTVKGNETNMAILEGRRQVWLHIQSICNLTGEQVQQFATRTEE